MKQRAADNDDLQSRGQKSETCRSWEVAPIAATAFSLLKVAEMQEPEFSQSAPPPESRKLVELIDDYIRVDGCVRFRDVVYSDPKLEAQCLRKNAAMVFDEAERSEILESASVLEKKAYGTEVGNAADLYWPHIFHDLWPRGQLTWFARPKAGCSNWQRIPGSQALKFRVTDLLGGVLKGPEGEILYDSYFQRTATVEVAPNSPGGTLKGTEDDGEFTHLLAAEENRKLPVPEGDAIGFLFEKLMGAWLALESEEEVSEDRNVQRRAIERVWKDLDSHFREAVAAGRIQKAQYVEGATTKSHYFSGFVNVLWNLIPDDNRPNEFKHWARLVAEEFERDPTFYLNDGRMPSPKDIKNITARRIEFITRFWPDRPKQKVKKGKGGFPGISPD